MKQYLLTAATLATVLATGYAIARVSTPSTYSQPYCLHVRSEPTPNDILRCSRDANCMDIILENDASEASDRNLDQKEGGQR